MNNVTTYDQANNEGEAYHEWLVKEIADMERRIDNFVVSPGMQVVFGIYLASLRRDLRQSMGEQE